MSDEKFELDEYGRRIRDDKTVPAYHDAKRLDVWRGALLDPGTVLTGWNHRPGQPCTGWIRSVDWWFVCGCCYPDAIDMGTGDSRNQRSPVSVVSNTGDNK